MEEKKVVFADGLIVKKPGENAPDFIKLDMAYKVDEFIKFLKDNEYNGWVNTNLKISKQGKLYVQLNDYARRKNEQSKSNGNDSQEEYNKAAADLEWDNF